MGSVIQAQSKRGLVLTHTNAGVEVLRRRLQRYQVAPGNVTVQTIDSWCRYLSERFPALASVAADADNVYLANSRGALRVLAASHIQRLLGLTRPGRH